MIAVQTQHINSDESMHICRITGSEEIEHEFALTIMIF